jgi:SAM-dependent methyltransferase
MRRCLNCERRFDGPSWSCPSCGFAPPVIDTIPRFAAPTANDGFHSDAFDTLAELEHGSFWFRARNRLLNWAMESYFPAAGTLLEIGCGTGFVLEGFRQAFPKLRIAGGELHDEGLVHASRRLPGVSLMQMDARHIPFDGEFDVVGAFDVLEHIDEDTRALSEIFVAVKRGGGILITVPQHPWLWGAADDYGEHKRRYLRAELVGKVTAAGFRVRRVTSFVSFLLPAMAAVRVDGKLRPRRPDPFRELRPTHATSMLERILDFERRSIEHGADLPFGGSLLLVANRP